MAEFVIHKGDTTKRFNDEDEFNNMVALLEDQGVDFEVEQPDGTDDTQDESVEAEEPNEPEQEESTQESVEAEVVTQDEELPSRELTDDPIEWLKQGSDEFVVEIKGTPVITKKGFRVLQHKYDISTGSEIIVGPEETDHEFARAKAWAEMPDGRRAEAHASAHVDRDDDHFLLTSMADTRAKSRALSDVTGVGAVAIEEMQGLNQEE